MTEGKKILCTVAIIRIESLELSDQELVSLNLAIQCNLSLEDKFGFGKLKTAPDLLQVDKEILKDAFAYIVNNQLKEK